MALDPATPDAVVPTYACGRVQTRPACTSYVPPRGCRLGRKWRCGLPARRNCCSTDQWWCERNRESPLLLTLRSTRPEGTPMIARVLESGALLMALRRLSSCQATSLGG